MTGSMNFKYFWLDLYLEMYVLRLGRFSMVYGSLGTLVIFVLWVYYSSAILLLGGEIAFLLEKGRSRI